MLLDIKKTTRNEAKLKAQSFGDSPAVNWKHSLRSLSHFEYGPSHLPLTLAILQGTANWMLGMGCVAWLVECLPGLPKALGSVFSIA